MKKLPVLILGFLLCLASKSRAQDSHTTDTDRSWIKPDHVTIQYAGNIGFLSAGPGYSYLHDNMNTDFLYGFTPGFDSNTSIHILTAKTAYTPWHISLSESWIYEPIRLGTGISYSFGSQFHTSWPKKYPDEYYWWASSLRLTPFLGMSVSSKVGNDESPVKRLELYVDLGTTDLDIASKATNSSISLWDITNIAVGTKIVF